MSNAAVAGELEGEDFASIVVDAAATCTDLIGLATCTVRLQVLPFLFNRPT